MKIVGERKTVAARLAEITGTESVYTRMPRCAYEIGPFAIELDGSVTVSESTDFTALSVLAQEGLLEGYVAPEEAQEDEEAEEAIERATEAQEALGETEKSESAEGSADVTDAAESSTEECDATASTEETDIAEETQEAVEEGSPETLTISMPLTGHTASSLRNLVAMVYSRGPLLAKATGGMFSCPLEQVEALKDCVTVEDVLAHLSTDLIGLSFEDDLITFTGFPMTEDGDKIQAFTHVAAQMGKAAKEHKRIQPKVIDTTNERYAFRIWLQALSMSGEEFKTARRALLAPLSGSSAFKDDAMEQRWKEKQAAKRDARRAAKEELQQAEEGVVSEAEEMYTEVNTDEVPA